MPPPRRRTEMPQPAQAEKSVSLWSILKECVGKVRTRSSQQPLPDITCSNCLHDGAVPAQQPCVCWPAAADPSCF